MHYTQRTIAADVKDRYVRTIGLIGGCSHESTTIYYTRINQLVRQHRPGHGAKVLLWSFDIADIQALIDSDDWSTAADRFISAAQRLEGAGADCLLICTNTMHRIAPEVARSVRVHLIHLVDETATATKLRGGRAPLLLGTRYTMEQEFYLDRLREAGLDALVPDAMRRGAVHEIIYGELMNGTVHNESRELILGLIDEARERGVDSVILACTELGMLIRPGDVALPLIDTLEVHVQAAVDFALA